MSEKSSVGFEGRMTADEAAQQLENIAQGLRKGYLRLSAQGRSVSLSPSDRVYFEVSAQSRKGGGSLEVAVAWRPARESDVSRLEVSTEAPPEETGFVAASEQQAVSVEDKAGRTSDEDDD